MTEAAPYKWGLFNHNPALLMHATDRNAPLRATCTCGWASQEVPRRRIAEALAAEQEHLREVDEALRRWWALPTTGSRSA